MQNFSQVPIEIRVNDTSVHDEDDNAANVQYEVVGSNQILTLPSGDPVSMLHRMVKKLEKGFVNSPLD